MKWLAIAALLAAGCRHAPVARPYAAPTVAQLADELDARAARLSSLRAEAKIDHMARGAERVKVRVTILVARAGRLRIEAESPLGGAIATLVSDGKQFQMLDVRKNRFLTGEPTACNVGQLLGIELPPADVMSILSGGAPARLREGKLSWDGADGGRERLDAPTDDHGVLTVWLRGAPGAHEVTRAEYHDALGILRWRVKHEDYEAYGDVRLPRKTTVEQPARKADAEIRYRSLEPNVQFPDGAFQLTPPEGIPVEKVDCG